MKTHSLLTRALLTRLSEPSTWSGLAGLAVLLGMTQEEYIQYTLAITGLIGFVLAVILPEKSQPAEPGASE